MFKQKTILIDVNFRLWKKVLHLIRLVWTFLKEIYFQKLLVVGEKTEKSQNLTKIGNLTEKYPKGGLSFGLEKRFPLIETPNKNQKLINFFRKQIVQYWETL